MESLKSKIDSRVMMAAERTSLAWLRTSLALMGFGFVIARFGENDNAVWVGSFVVIIAILVCTLSSFQYRSRLKSMKNGHEPEAVPWIWQSLLTAVLVVLGSVLVIYLFQLS